VPLITKLSDSVDQIWYADDTAATGKICLRSWWDDIVTHGPSFGYFANASKTWLVVKPTFRDEASGIFGDTNIKITCEGRPYLGSALGGRSYTSDFVTGKVEQWTKELKSLSKIATSQPHAAFAAYTHGMASKWSYISRTIPDITKHLQTLEDTIRSEFIPSITGRSPPNDIVRNLMALPARLGGLGIIDPSRRSDGEFNASTRVTTPLQHLMEQRGSEFSYQVYADQMTAKRNISREREQMKQTASTLRLQLSSALSKAMDLASQPGASSWLTSLPIKEHGFCLHKGAFVDALAKPPHIASVVQPLQLSTYYRALVEVFHHCATTKSETSLQYS